MIKIINDNKELNYLALFLEKTITEKNLAQSSVNAYESDLKGFYRFLKKNNYTVIGSTYDILSLWIETLRKSSFEQSTLSRKISTKSTTYRISNFG